KFRRAVADLEAPGYAVANAIDGADTNGWTAPFTLDHLHENHAAAFECAEPVGFPGGTRLLFTINSSHRKENGQLDAEMLGCLRLSATTDAGALSVNPLTASQKKILAVPAEQRTTEQQRELFSTFRWSDPLCAELNKQIETNWAGWPYPPTT